MNKIVTLILALITVFSSFSQNVCRRTVADFGSFPTGGYMVLGSATLTDSLGTMYLTLDGNFFTTAGPDLFLFLAMNDEAPTVPGNTNVEVAALMSNSGAQSYVVPGNYSINDFDYVLIHCKQFNHFWDGGALGVTVCNPITGIEEEDIQIGEIIISNSVFDDYATLTVNSSIDKSFVLTIHAITGKLISSSVEQTNQEILIGNQLSSGLYIISIINNNIKIASERIIKR